MRCNNETSLGLSSRYDVFSSSSSCSNGLSGENKHSLPSFFWSISSCNQSIFQDWFSCWSNILYDISILSILLAKKTCPIISGEIASPPECPWIERMYAKDPWEVSQYSNLTLLLPLWIWSIDSDYFNSSAPFSQNPLNNLGRIVSQCTAPSVSRSSWSKWRSNLTPSSIFAMRQNTKSTIDILELSSTFFSEYQWFSSWSTLDSLWVEQDSVLFC